MALNEFQLSALKILYDRCCNKADTKPGTLLASTFGSRKNRIYAAIVQSKYESTEYDPVAMALKTEGYIRSLEHEPGSYTITAKGAWIVETECYGKSPDEIIEELDKKYFSVVQEKLSDKNKVLLLSLVAVHAFSEKCGVNYTELGVEQDFLNMNSDSFTLLKKLDRVSTPSFDSFFTAKNNQKKKTAQLTSSIDVLPHCTNSLFVAKRNNYYLELLKNGEIDKTALKDVIRVIFDKISITEIDYIIDTCKEMSLRYSCTFCKDDQVSDIECNHLIENCVNELAGL